MMRLMLLSDVEDLKFRIRHDGKLVELSSMRFVNLEIDDPEFFLQYLTDHYLLNIKEQ